MRRTRETGWKFSNVGYAGRGVNGEGAFPASPPVLKRLDGWLIVVTILPRGVAAYLLHVR